MNAPYRLSGDDVTTARGITIPAAALAWRFSHGTGPGGQGVNTTDSRVELTVDLTRLGGEAHALERVRSVLGDSFRVVVTTERSQLRNRELAVSRVVERIDEAATPRRVRRATRPTRTSALERLETKQIRSDTKARRRPPAPDD